MAKSVLIALRLPSETKQQIDKLVEAGQFKNLSELIRQAIREFLEGVKNESS